MSEKKGGRGKQESERREDRKIKERGGEGKK